MFQEKKPTFRVNFLLLSVGSVIVANKVMILNLLGRLLINPFKLNILQIILKSFTHVTDMSYVKNRCN